MEPPGDDLAVRSLARQLALEGHLPLAPQIYLPRFLDEDTERQLAMDLCLKLARMADEVWAYGDLSDGMRVEITEAHRLGIPVVVRDREAMGDRGIKSLQLLLRTGRAATRAHPQVRVGGV